MDKQEREAREKFKELDFKKKREYIWEYYKAHIISAVVVVALIVSGIVGYVNRPRYDFEVSMYTLYGFDEAESEALCNILEKHCKDTDNDGKVNVNLVQAIGEITNPMFSQAAQANLTRFQAELVVNNHPTLILDDVYKEYLELDSIALAKSIYDLSQNKEICDALNITQGSGLYLVTMEKYGDAEKDENLYQNSLNLEKYFCSGKK